MENKTLPQVLPARRISEAEIIYRMAALALEYYRLPAPVPDEADKWRWLATLPPDIARNFADKPDEECFNSLLFVVWFQAKYGCTLEQYYQQHMTSAEYQHYLLMAEKSK